MITSLLMRSFAPSCGLRRMPAAVDQVTMAFDPAALLIYDRDNEILIEEVA